MLSGKSLSSLLMSGEYRNIEDDVLVRKVSTLRNKKLNLVSMNSINSLTTGTLTSAHKESVVNRVLAN